MANAKSAAPAMSAFQMNQLQRNAVLANSIDQWILTSTQTFTTALSGGPGSVINLPVRNIGLNKRFVILVRAQVSSAGTETNTLTTFGPANFFSNVTLSDLNNQLRVNTSGAHLHYLKTVRDRNAAFAAFNNDSPTAIGNNYGTIKAPGALTSTTPQELTMVYEVPISYSDTDLRGAIYANVVNATWNLQVTVNPNMFASSTGNAVNAVYKSSSVLPGRLISWTVEVYQNFLENLPVDGNRQVILPMLDLSTMYRIENTVQAGLVPNQEQSAPYANYRQFMSTFLVYDNNGVLNPGTDINYVGIQLANTTNLFRFSPQMIAARTRDRIGDDLPPATYYFDHRNAPIETSQFGNVQLTFYPNAVGGATSQMLLWYEYFANMQLVQSASAISN